MGTLVMEASTRRRVRSEASATERLSTLIAPWRVWISKYLRRTTLEDRVVTSKDMAFNCTMVGVGSTSLPVARCR